MLKGSSSPPIWLYLDWQDNDRNGFFIRTPWCIGHIITIRCRRIDRIGKYNIIIVDVRERVSFGGFAKEEFDFSALHRYLISVDDRSIPLIGWLVKLPDRVRHSIWFHNHCGVTNQFEWAILIIFESRSETLTVEVRNTGDGCIAAVFETEPNKRVRLCDSLFKTFHVVDAYCYITNNCNGEWMNLYENHGTTHSSRQTTDMTGDRMYASRPYQSLSFVIYSFTLLIILLTVIIYGIVIIHYLVVCFHAHY
jgi:hypothetical protein